jgi:hypothetical protein
MATLPENVERFLASYIDSVDQLELAILLFNSPQTEWSAAAASQVVHCSESVAQEKLERLAAHGLLAVRATPQKTYRYAPQDEALATLTQAMADTYRERPVSVIRRIYEQPVDPLRAFADAFKIKPKE